MLQQIIDQKERRITALEAIVRAMEWQEMNLSGERVLCPFCGRHKNRGHRGDEDQRGPCRLAAALAQS